ncbi:MetQ/NlpA family ABC transporter substrate-binding protein [Clostridium aminobutyricum]|uniref:Lipoprotein n=1 Tax=Clostridium aminobutyricum TaxID=33953 RepID=A0A939DBC1_CLOAM|nr:MetQ/NlpA family ABC transporter substrate-binding protein [Clostridium aminobutyricum]MBN7774472.1 MetQ/NlpA family ABC transporter substrate-binding protein [Clostridium aminobutyricum]
MKLKKLLALALVLTLAVSVAACGKSSKDSEENADKVTVKVGVVGEDNAMWTPIIENLAKEGIDVQLVSFSDYTTPNQALDNGEIDLNAFQHHAYLDSEVQNNGYKITSIGDTYISAMNIYSKNIKDISEIKKGDKIAVPNDASNEGRALKVVASAGLIKLDPNAGDSPELTDITENPLNLEFVEVDAANVYTLLPDVAAGVINCNYALDSGLNPGKDSIFHDDVNFYTGNSYNNLIAARTEDADNEVYKKVVDAYQSEEVKAVFADVFKGAYIAAWK